MNIATLKVRIGADIRELEQAMSRAQRTVQDTSRRLTDMGKTLSKRVTAPIVGFAGLSVRSFGQIERATVQLNAAMQANGTAVEGLMERYQDFADEIQNTTTVSDDATLAMLAQAEQMGLTGDAAERTVKNAIAMQSAFDVSAERAIRYTAALEHGEATMLRRYIPALRGVEDDAEMAAEAHRILGNAFQAAEAEAGTTIGRLQQLRNEMSNVMEDVGEVVSVALMPLIDRLQDALKAFQGLEQEVQRNIIVIGGLVAAIGPALVIIGKLGAALAVLLTPIALKIAALTALGLGVIYVWRNLDVFADRLPRVTSVVRGTAKAVQWLVNDMRALYDRVRSLIDGVNDLVYTYDDWKEENKDLVKSNEDVKDSVPEEEDAKEFERFGDFFGYVASGVVDSIGWMTNQVTGYVWGLISDMNDATKAVKDTSDEIQESLSREFGEAIEMARTDVIGLNSALEDTSHLSRRVSTELNEVPEHLSLAFDTARASLDEMSVEMQVAESIGMRFTQSFGDGMANVVVQGERLVDVLQNIGRLMLSAGIQTAIQLMLGGSGMITGGGITGGILGRVFSVNDAMITSRGDVVKFHPNDNILAMQDFSGIGGGGATSVRIEPFVLPSGDIKFAQEKAERIQTRTSRR